MPCNGEFTDGEIMELSEVYHEVLEKSDWTDSARDAHYVLMKFGYHGKFTNNRQLEDFVGYIITCRRFPDETDFRDFLNPAIMLTPDKGISE